MERKYVKFLKNSTTIDFTMFQYIIAVFLTMYREDNHKKITELCLVEIAEMHYLQWFEGDCFRP